MMTDYSKTLTDRQTLDSQLNENRQVNYYLQVSILYLKTSI